MRSGLGDLTGEEAGDVGDGQGPDVARQIAQKSEVRDQNAAAEAAVLTSGISVLTSALSGAGTFFVPL